MMRSEEERYVDRAERAAFIRGVEAMRETAAKKADAYAEQNRDQAADSQRRANRLGDDPLGHMAASAAIELDVCQLEAKALAAMIRALPIPEDTS